MNLAMMEERRGCAPVDKVGPKRASCEFGFWPRVD